LAEITLHRPLKHFDAAARQTQAGNPVSVAMAVRSGVSSGILGEMVRLSGHAVVDAPPQLSQVIAAALALAARATPHKLELIERLASK
jgi:hypothetical protein